eukprot:473312-Prymnesium_polylepis.1
MRSHTPAIAVQLRPKQAHAYTHNGLWRMSGVPCKGCRATFWLFVRKIPRNSAKRNAPLQVYSAKPLVSETAPFLARPL